MPQLIIAKPASSSANEAPSRSLLPRTMATIETTSAASRMIQDSRTGLSSL